MSQKIGVGDVVKHLPSGEKWVVGGVSGAVVWPLGWPLTRASLDDCVPVANGQSTAGERLKLLRDLANISDISDPRRNLARLALGLDSDQSAAEDPRAAEIARLRSRVEALEQYASLLESGLSAHEARGTVWPQAEDPEATRALKREKEGE